MAVALAQWAWNLCAHLLAFAHHRLTTTGAFGIVGRPVGSQSDGKGRRVRRPARTSYPPNHTQPLKTGKDDILAPAGVAASAYVATELPAPSASAPAPAATAAATTPALG